MVRFFRNGAPFFAPLSEADDAALANARKVKADTMAVLLDRQKARRPVAPWKWRREKNTVARHSAARFVPACKGLLHAEHKDAPTVVSRPRDFCDFGNRHFPAKDERIIRKGMIDKQARYW